MRNHYETQLGQDAEGWWVTLTITGKGANAHTWTSRPARLVEAVNEDDARARSRAMLRSLITTLEGRSS